MTKNIYYVTVEQRVKVEIDADKFTPEFLSEFNSTISDWGDDLEEHAKHLAWVHATGVEALDSGPRSGAFVEGYGPVAEMGIRAETESTYVEVVESSK